MVSMRGLSKDIAHEEIASAQEKERERILIPPGDYEAQCVKYKEFRQYGGCRKLCLEWSFFLSGKEGLFLPQYLNMEHKVFKETSYYYINWVIANDYQKPPRRTRQYMPPKVFIDITAIVLIETVKPRFPDGSEMPEPFHYSKVAFIKRKTTGGVKA